LPYPYFVDLVFQGHIAFLVSDWQHPSKYTKTSTVSTNQNSKFRSLSVVGNITNIRRIAQKTTEPAPPNSDE
jgi:hypothetical protein